VRGLLLVKSTNNLSKKNLKIWIDPGHGFGNRNPNQFDPGAVTKDHTEAEIVLMWGLAGRWVLNTEFGIDTFLTRDDDSDYAFVGTRAAQAMAANCDYGISLHMNAAGVGATGTEVFYRDAADKRFSNLVLNAAIKALGLNARGVKSEGQSQHQSLAVMDFKPPMALLELGFITNPTDLKQCLDRNNRIEFWRFIGAALTE
jgi:N-acetylmuramoyl-L-alanine amidase